MHVIEPRLSYRCHFTKNSKIRYGRDLTETSLPGALAEASVMLKGRRSEFDGFEVWQGDQLLYVADNQTEMILDISVA